MRSQMLFPGGLMALLWGFGYALFLWQSRPGRWLRLQKTWISVVIGVGGNLAALALVLEPTAWLVVLGCFALSGLSIVGHSLFVSEYGDHLEQMSRGLPPGGE